MGNKTTHPLSESEEQEPSALPPSGRQRTLRDPGESIEEADDLEVAEVPPPMRPISSIPGPEDSKPRVRMLVIPSCLLTARLSAAHIVIVTSCFSVTQIFLQFIKLEEVTVPRVMKECCFRTRLTLPRGTVTGMASHPPLSLNSLPPPLITETTLQTWGTLQTLSLKP